MAAYLGIAAAAHLSPFPAKKVAATSSQSARPTNSGNPSSSSSPHPTVDPSPTSDYDILLAKIPGSVRGQNNCQEVGISDGATAQIQCTRLHGAATAAIYYLFSDTNSLNNGFKSFLDGAGFNKAGHPKSCKSNGKFAKFIVQCEDSFSITSPAASGNVAEYVRVNDFDPIIASTDNQQLVMAIMVGTNQGSLLSYWQQLQWIVT